MTQAFLTDSEGRITIEYMKDGKWMTSKYHRAVDMRLDYEPIYQEVNFDGYAKIFKDSAKLSFSANLLPGDDGKYGKIFATDKPLAAKLDAEYDSVVARRVDDGVEVFIGGRWRKVSV